MQEGPVGFWPGSLGEWQYHLRAGQATHDRRNSLGEERGCWFLDVLSLRGDQRGSPERRTEARERRSNERVVLCLLAWPVTGSCRSHAVRGGPL